ncbi:MAG: class I SAM-dependent methyltransferase [Verrucomicrobiota bacterium]
MTYQKADGFGRLARPYQFLERVFLGRALDELRFCFLERAEVQAAQTVLILGEGDGRFLKAALEQMPKASFQVVDFSPGMLEVAEARLSQEERLRVSFTCRDARDYDFVGSQYDGLVMHCFLDCFSEQTLQDVLPRWLGLVRAGGWVWIGDFVEPRMIGWRWLRLRALYRFFRVITGIEAKRVADPLEILCSSGFALLGDRSTARGACRSRVFQRIPED